MLLNKCHHLSSNNIINVTVFTKFHVCIIYHRGVLEKLLLLEMQLGRQLIIVKKKKKFFKYTEIKLYIAKKNNYSSAKPLVGIPCLLPVSIYLHHN